MSMLPLFPSAYVICRVLVKNEVGCERESKANTVCFLEIYKGIYDIL